MPILSLQCINTRSAFSLANFSTSLAALPAIRCHSGTLFRFNWSCGKQILNNNKINYRCQILSYCAFCWLCKKMYRCEAFVQIPWRFSSCHEYAFCPHLSPGRSQDCPGKPAGLLAKSTQDKVKWLKQGASAAREKHWLASWSTLPVPPSLY